MILGGILVAVTMTGMDQNMMQKNLSCKNIQEERKNNFPEIIKPNNEDEQGKENEPKQKLFAFKMDVETHKRLMRYKTENGIPIGEYINSAILESLEKDGF